MIGPTLRFHRRFSAPPEVEVIRGHVGAPVAHADAVAVDLRIVFQAAEIVGGQGHALQILKALVQRARQHLCVAEAMVRAGVFAVRVVVAAAEQQTVVCAFFIQIQIAQRGFREHGILLSEMEQHLLTAVAGAAAPVRPLERARADAVVPRAVGQHEFQMRAVAVDEDVERFLVAALHRVAAQRGEGFLHIVAAHIDGGAARFR